MSFLDGYKLQITAILALLIGLNEAFHWVPDSVRDAVIAIAAAFGITGLAGKFEKQKQATVALIEATKEQTAVLGAQTSAVVHAVNASTVEARKP